MQFWTSEKGLPLFKNGVAEYFLLLVLRRPPFARTGRPFASVVTKYLGIYGLTATPEMCQCQTVREGSARELPVHTTFGDLDDISMSQQC